MPFVLPPRLPTQRIAVLRRAATRRDLPHDETVEAGPNGVKLAWVTDPHFDHAKLDIWQAWADEVVGQSPDALIVTGDLSEGDDVAYQLRCMLETFDRPIYFVLGNHDFYGGRIADVRRHMVDLCRDLPNAHYLTDSFPIPITDNCVLVGEDGWGDATCGDFANSIVRLHDFQLIEDFIEADPSQWQDKLIAEGLQSADRLRGKLNALPPTAEHVLIATHVPPFRESCWYEGRTTDDHWAPFFVCGQVGQMLREIAEANPGQQYTVLCGHTHHDGDAEILPNLKVHTGYSRYGTLDIESIIEVTQNGFDVPRSPGTNEP